MLIAISELLIRNRILIVIQSFLVFLIVPVWVYGDRFVDPQIKTEKSILLLTQVMATFVIVCIVLVVACLDLIKKTRELEMEHKRSIICQWRKMVHEISNAQDNSGKPVSYLIERHEAYYSLKPHLSHTTIREIASTRTFFVGSTICTPLQLIIDEISRLEREWNLT